MSEDRKPQNSTTAWQPIETAPRDGTDVLLLYQHRWMTKPQPIVGGFFEGGWYSYERPEHEIEAVKWAPIPEFANHD